MNEKEKEYIVKNMQDYSNLNRKFLRSAIDDISKLQMTKLDHLRTTSTLVVGIAGAIYLLIENFSKEFLIASIFCSLLTIVWVMSYVREEVVRQVSNREKIGAVMKAKRDELYKKGQEAISKNDFSIFFNYTLDQAKEPDAKKAKDYSTDLEIFNFLFFLSIGFLALSYLSSKYHFNIMSLQTATMLVLVYLLSYKSWAISSSTFLNIKIEKGKQNKKRG
ncbi:hypothetical protein KJ980_04660 [Patescibacteria group bacterium]|nr:hypothetical protein [Patescibacteria group bacterium]MBU4016930.1 hypothetical protein [Patescibacteria group bacterium]MBU4098915.1 hypothetical protein [Patescibacteria group bacterium]